MHDLLTDAHYQWEGARNFVMLDPAGRCRPTLRTSGSRRQAPAVRRPSRRAPDEPPVAVTEAAAGPSDGVRHWYKDAVIYELHVRAFRDSNGDGVGDFRGLIEKLDYLQELGVTALWLLPFYPSPLRDDGYDISDYRQVHPSLRHPPRLPRLPPRGAPPRHCG